jgi:hypothetical protein
LMVLGLTIGTWGVLAPGSVPAFLLGVVHVAVGLTLSLIQRMAAWRYVVRPLTPPPWYVIGLYYGFLFGILFMIRRRKIHENHRPRLQRG